MKPYLFENSFPSATSPHASERPDVLAGQITPTARGVNKAFRSHREHHIRCAPEGAVPDPMQPIPEAALKYRYDQEKPVKNKSKGKSAADAPAVTVAGPSSQGATQSEPVPPASTPEEYVAQSQVPLTNAVAAAKVGRSNRKPVNYKGLGTMAGSSSSSRSSLESKSISN